MSDWTNEQTVAIARRVIAEPSAGSDRLLWAAMTLSAAEFVMGERLTDAERNAMARVMSRGAGHQPAGEKEGEA
jgi:hypothetical protein